MNNIKKYDELENIENNPKNIKINFDKFSKLNIKAWEIFNCELTGSLSDEKGKISSNVVMCNLNQFESTNSNFERIDWKDTNVRKSHFNKTSFDNSAVINCYFSESSFMLCHFKDVSITGTVFFETEFRDCDLSNMVIENCYFYNCQFNNCVTNNKLFEQCLLIGCAFNNTNIQLDTITENFGIEIKQLINSCIKDKANNRKYKFLKKSELKRLCNEEGNLHTIFRFKIDFFLEPEIVLHGSTLFDRIFNLNEWVPLFKVKSTFLNSFKLFHDFLIIHFERNNLPVYALYKLRELTKWLSEAPQIKNNFELYPILVGYDISLSRILSQTNQLIQQYGKDINNELILLVNGPLKKSYYETILKKFIQADFKIVNIVKQNSPNIMEIVAVTTVIIQIIALFVSTRVKVELKEKKHKNKKNSKLEKFEQPSPYNLIEFGDKNEDILKMYFTQSTVPHIVFSKYKSKDFGMIREIIINIHEK